MFSRSFYTTEEQIHELFAKYVGAHYAAITPLTCLDVVRSNDS